MVYVGVGKVFFGEDKLVENVCVFMGVVLKVKFVGVKGVYVKKVVLSFIMGSGVIIDVDNVVFE